MAGYEPLHIQAPETGLIQSRPNFVLPKDAYPVLQNAYVWREKLVKKQGCEQLGRLRRKLTGLTLGPSLASPWTFNLLTRSGYVRSTNNANPGEITTLNPHNLTTGDIVSVSGIDGATGYNNKSFTITVTGDNTFTIGEDATGFGVYSSGGQWLSNRALGSLEPSASLDAGSVFITIGAIEFQDQGDGTLSSVTPGNSGYVNYVTGNVSLTHTAGTGVNTTLAYNYFPGLPSMGCLTRELPFINFEETVFFDTRYAYFYNDGFEEFIPGTVWTGDDSDFFWPMNYGAGSLNDKIFWVTNFSNDDPIRYTNGATWVDFAPQVNAGGDYLLKALCMVPFRGRVIVFNTYEGTTLGTSQHFYNRIRWCSIGTPFSTASPIVSSVDPNAWRDDITGKGGFIDMPTTQDIISVGFVRDNLVIYCERSTWQLRYTGRSIQPFQLEKVNTELGAESTFSTVQFDTSLVGMGDKGVVECDSFKAERIDFKIPDLVYNFNNESSGYKRVYGIRDFQKRLAYWSYVTAESNQTYPNKRLVFNYENQSWAIFDDSFTCFGVYQDDNGRTWENTDIAWEDADFIWLDRPALFPSIVGGNQKGFISYLDSKVINDPTLEIQNIQVVDGETIITCRRHNLTSQSVISITGILDNPAASPSYAVLNDKVYGLSVVDINTFKIYEFNPETGQFDKSPEIESAVYVGGGLIAIKDNFIIQSKQFGFSEEGQAVQFSFLDILINSTSNGQITLNVYVDSNTSAAVNRYPYNQGEDGISPDLFFNSVIETVGSESEGAQTWQRFYCPARGSFITLEYTFSNEQLNSNVSNTDVELLAQVLYMRRAGRQLLQID